MANKLKNSKKSNKEKPKSTATDLKPEKEEKIDLKKLAKDERTWKITGAVSILISLFLFISFVSYFFTWDKDQAEVFNHSIFESHGQFANLLGALGAYSSYFFIKKCFGIAAFLLCTFFFVSGVNLLVGQKIFSVWRNLRYVVVGILVISTSLSFVFGKMDPNSIPVVDIKSGFYGGSLGDLLSSWLVGFMGKIGTTFLLLTTFLAYIIWQFNPVFKLPKKKEIEPVHEQQETGVVTALTGKTINDLYSDKKTELTGNSLKGNGSLIVVPKEELNPIPLKVIEKDESFVDPIIPKEITKDLMHEHDDLQPEKFMPEKIKTKPVGNLELEIKSTLDTPGENEDELKQKGYEQLAPYEPTLDLRDYKYPSIDLLETHGGERIIQDPLELQTNKNQIISTLGNYDIEIQKISATIGPTVTLYEIVPAAGVRISRIKNLEDDIALNLAALGIRIIAPIPGKGTIGIEVPNVKKSIVSMKTLIASEKFQHNNYSLPIAIGKKIDNENFIVDLASMPHLLMAGATGQGKSVGVNAILVSLLYKKHPSQLKFVLIDPKKVELSLYNKIEKHFLAKLPGEEDAIITDTKKVINTLNALCIEMDNRYDLLKEAGARNIKEYNEKFTKRRLNPQKGHQYLPFIVLVIDEFADMIMTAGKEIEMPIARLAQLARAVGIHLVIATQRPSVNIITGTIKANFPSRIAFKVSSKIDSRTILDMGGAEQLIGKGDMLISHHGEITRLQCAFIDTPEVDSIVDFIGEQRGYPQAFLLPEYIDEKEMEGRDFDMSDRDPLFQDAARLIVQNQIGSTSLLQRRMKLGYNRAGRLMDQLEAFRIVGPSQGSKARDVLVKTESELNEILTNL
jgi:DNA segregation ATPase FtsK/SpoIIIE, S-DNA-T family